MTTAQHVRTASRQMKFIAWFKIYGFRLLHSSWSYIHEWCGSRSNYGICDTDVMPCCDCIDHLCAPYGFEGAVLMGNPKEYTTCTQEGVYKIIINPPAPSDTGENV